MPKVQLIITTQCDILLMTISLQFIGSSPTKSKAGFSSEEDSSNNVDTVTVSLHLQALHFAILSYRRYPSADTAGITLAPASSHDFDVFESVANIVKAVKGSLCRWVYFFAFILNCLRSLIVISLLPHVSLFLFVFL